MNSRDDYIYRDQIDLCECLVGGGGTWGLKGAGPCSWSVLRGRAGRGNTLGVLGNGNVFSQFSEDRKPKTKALAGQHPEASQLQEDHFGFT